jgi:hypothetical protein
MKKLVNIFTKIFTFFFILLFIGLILYFLKYKVSINNLDFEKIFKLLFLFSNLFFWIWVLISKKKSKKILISSYFAVICSLYSAEFFLEKQSKFQKFEFYLKENKNYDTRSKFEIYNDLKKTEDISPIYYPYNQLLKNRSVKLNELNNKKVFLLSSISNKNTITCNESGKYLIYKSDRYGFNNPDNLWDNDVEGVVIGDSMTLGECVDKSEDIVSLLRNSLKKNYINLGMGGSGPIIELGVLKEITQIINPKKIIWIYHEGNDLLDIYNEEKNSILIKYLIPSFSQTIFKHQKYLDSKINEIIDEEYNQYKANKFKSFLFLWRVRDIFQSNIKNESKKNININEKIPSFYEKLIVTNSKTPYRDKINLLKKTLEELKNHSNLRGINEIYFVYLPSLARFNGEFEDNDNLFARSDVLEIVRDLDFKLIDIYKSFKENNINVLNFFPFKGKREHYNNEGYLYISNIIENKVTKK